MRVGWLVVAMVAGVGVGLVIGSTAFGDSPGPSLTVDQGFNSGHPVSPSFPPDGSGGSTGGVITATVIQPNGKIVTVGDNPAVNNNVVTADFDVARFNGDGTLDSSFGRNGYAQVAPMPSSVNSPTAVALDPNTGDIVIVGGDLSGPQDVPELVRLTSHGALDTTFGTGGSAVDSAHAGSFLKGLVIDSSSGIVTIGSDGVARRYSATGAPDTKFATGGHTGVLIVPSAFGTGTNAIAMQPADGRILVAGYSQTSGTDNATVVRLNSDGSLDSTFGSGGTATVYSGTGGDAVASMTLEATSIVVAGGDSSGDTILARLTSTGALDSTFGTDGFDTFASPSGYTNARSQVVFYDPHPGFVVCGDATTSDGHVVVCRTTGVDGGNSSNPITASVGGPFNAAAAILTAGFGNFVLAAYELSDFNISDGRSGGTPGGGGPGGGSSTAQTTPTASTTPVPCTPVKLEIGKFMEPFPFVSFPPDSVGEMPPHTHHYEVGYDPKTKLRPGIRFLIIVVNDGSCPATNVQLTDQLSSNVRYGSSFQAAGPPTKRLQTPGRLSAGGTVAVNIRSLLPGEEVQYEINADLGIDQSGTNTACVSGSFGQICSIPVVWQTVPAPRAKIATGNATSVQGDASAGGAPAKEATDARKRSRGAQVKAAAVEVAIERLTSGRTAHQTARCSWLANTKAKFKRRACDRPIWLKATGTTHWRLSYRRLGPGRYEVFAMALGKHGLSADTFSRGAGDTDVFIVR